MGGEFGWNHQGCTGYQEFVKELNLTGITKSPAKHLYLIYGIVFDSIVSKAFVLSGFLFFSKTMLYKGP